MYLSLHGAAQYAQVVPSRTVDLIILMNCICFSLACLGINKLERQDSCLGLNPCSQCGLDRPK